MIVNLKTTGFDVNCGIGGNIQNFIAFELNTLNQTLKVEKLA
jgi:hypothetical protein